MWEDRDRDPEEDIERQLAEIVRPAEPTQRAMEQVGVYNSNDGRMTTTSTAKQPGWRILAQAATPPKPKRGG